MNVDILTFMHVMHAALAERENLARRERVDAARVQNEELARCRMAAGAIEGECVEVTEVKQLPYDGKPTWFD